MILGTGSRLYSAVDTTEVVVVRAPAVEVELTCGGATMLTAAAPTSAAPAGEPAPGPDAGTRIGKRYTRDAGDVEVLVVKPGRGSLALDGEILTVRQAKPLPASD